MSIKEIEGFSPDLLFADLKERATYYVTAQIMDAYDKTDAARKKIQTVEDFRVYQEHARNVFKNSVGEIPYDREYPLNARITGRIEEKDLVIENVIFEAREKVYVTANLYLPKKRDEKSAAVLLQCGHSENGKAAPSYQRAARIIASVGIIVMVMDPPGQGERLNYMKEGSNTPLIPGAVSHHQQFGNQCFLAGVSPVKYFLADALRGIDYLCSRKEVDSERIGATGNSGGGTMTAVLMGIDERIKAAAPSCWSTSGREYYFVGMSPDSEQVWPGTLINGFDHYEVMACMCPRPLMILAAEEDFVPIEGTEKLFAECKRLWKLNGNAGKVEMTIGKGGHGYSPELAVAASRFFRQHLCGSPADTGTWKDCFSVEEINILPDKVLQCTKSGQVKWDFKDSIFVYHENLREYQKNRAKLPPLEERRKILLEHIWHGRQAMDRFHVRHFATMQDSTICAEPIMWFTQSLMPCYGIQFRDTGRKEKKMPVTICLWQGGTDCVADHLKKIQGICREGRIAMVVDLTAMGKCTPNMTLRGYDPGEHINGVIDRLSKHLFLLGDSLCAIRAFDLLQTIRMLREALGIEDIKLYAREKYAIFARIVQMLDEKVGISLQDEVSVEELISSEYYDTYDIAQVLMPGLGKYLD